MIENDSLPTIIVRSFHFTAFQAGKEAYTNKIELSSFFNF